MPLGYAEAIAIAIPSSSFIVTLGCVIVKYKRGNSGPPKNSNNSYVGRKEFAAVVNGISTELRLTREGFKAGIDEVKEQIKGLKP